MASSGSPFSLRPWPTGDKKPKNLSEFITRVNAERGGFRNMTETELREEIAAQEDGHIEVDRSSDGEEEEETDTDKPKNVMITREEFLKNLEFAHQSAMLGLDFISLLCSKNKLHDPNKQREIEKREEAMASLSPTLRELVPIGSLGAAKVNASNITEPRKQDDLAIATGWRLMGINNMVDSVVAAAEKLEKEMELEAKYWADILAVSENGWSVCALPQEPHTLGVRFGFAESAPEFRNTSIAPLRRNDDGTVRLDLGRVGGGSQRVRVTLKKNGQIVDQSPLPRRTPDDAPLEDRVLEARNTAFHQELWYEINREARTLLSSDVYSDSSCIIWKQDSETQMIFTLEDLAEPDNKYEKISNTQCSCTAHYVYMQFLLFQGHRQNYHRRTTMTQLPPNRGALHQPYTIIRAVIANNEYFRHGKIVANFLEDMVFTLKRAGISTAACKSASQPLLPALLQGNSTRQNAKTELNFVNHLAGRLESLFELTITPEARIFARGHILIVPHNGMVFRISLVPFSVQNSGGENNNNTASEKEKGPPNPLETMYPPVEQYPNAKEATHYIRQAAIRALVQKLAEEAREKLHRDDIDFNETIRGPGVKGSDDKEARIDITDDVDGQLVLSLDAQWQAGKDIASRRWTWRADRDDAGGESVTDVVVKVMQGHPSL
ncbi:subunit 17 of mediator complex-domain-containing protein [Annulohypoxylon maeteangense]|uniref:subunit 17 of mediator complex-domain-containing protein n=1 Tax=Annulohypoxylon maeteangense TaxID=1927788 RepID=UPI0020080C20|nr:subunit 17 of mediator complex-domain-containing protein [Annulohypoxylon maeteangense]KAI0883863.1 subunit 17 of mediator complex-domain-containing protein [Annulohypoxylon maeteangense]